MGLALAFVLSWVIGGRSFIGPHLTLKQLKDATGGGDRRRAHNWPPERIGGERNWDDPATSGFRDAAFCVHALLQLGFEDEATSVMDFLTLCATGDGSPQGPLQVMYGIDGRLDLPERELPDLEGYRGSAPVRVGNGAASSAATRHLW